MPVVPIALRPFRHKSTAVDIAVPLPRFASPAPSAAVLAGLIGAAVLIAAAPVRADEVSSYSLPSAEACPAGTVHITVAEAQAHKDQLCRRLGQWDIRRLADGGVMQGRGYQCGIRANDPRPMGGAICKPAAGLRGMRGPGGPVAGPATPQAYPPPPPPPEQAVPIPGPTPEVTSGRGMHGHHGRGAGGYVAFPGSCRGPNWNAGGWPRSQGYQTPAECQAACDRTAGCTSFDLARPRGSRFDCFLFGSPNVAGDTRSGGDLCLTRSPRADLVRGSVAFLASQGSCRGRGWSGNGWPRPLGYRTAGEAAMLCRDTPGCTGFDLARPQNGRFDASLFGHERVGGDGSPDLCFAVATFGGWLAGPPPGQYPPNQYPPNHYPPPQPPPSFVLVEGELCPPGTLPVTFAEAQANKDQLCRQLGQWDIRRLADGGAMDGAGYSCNQRERDERPMGGAVCRTDAPMGPPLDGPVAMPVRELTITLSDAGENCPDNTSHLTYADAAANLNFVCSRLGQWDIRRLAGGASLSGSGYGCGLKSQDPRRMGGAICTP